MARKGPRNCSGYLLGLVMTARRCRLCKSIVEGLTILYKSQIRHHLDIHDLVGICEIYLSSANERIPIRISTAIGIGIVNFCVPHLLVQRSLSRRYRLSQPNYDSHLGAQRKSDMFRSLYASRQTLGSSSNLPTNSFLQVFKNGSLVEAILLAVIISFSLSEHAKLLFVLRVTLHGRLDETGTALTLCLLFIKPPEVLHPVQPPTGSHNNTGRRPHRLHWRTAE